MASSVKPKLQPPPPAARRAPTGPARPELLPSARALALGVAVAAPAPLNTPSRRREQPPAVDATHSPAGPRWGSPAALADVPAAPLAARPAACDNVWASGHVAELLHPTKPAGATVAKIQPSGRWGDDAVEQDIERRTRERQQARNREFPDLKEAAVIEEHRHEQHAHDRWGRADRFQRDDRFDRAPREERYIDHRFDGVKRDFADVPRRDGGLVGRWARDFNAQPNNANPRFSPNNANPRFSPNNANPRFSPNDARFDMAPASRAAPVARPHPTAEPEMDVHGRYPSPPHYSNVPEDPHHHHEPRSTLPDGSEKPNAAASPVQSADSQEKDSDHPDDHSEQPAAIHEKSPVAELPSPKHESTLAPSAAAPRHFSPTMGPMVDRHKNDSLAHYHDFRAPVWSHPARFDDPEDFEDPLDWRARPHGSARNSHRRTAKPNEIVERERKMSSLSHTSSSSSSVEKQNASTDAKMRILKRDAPKMLFDPKTGGMVSAEKDDKLKKPQQQQAQNQKPQAITRKQDQAGAEAEAVGGVLPQVEDPSEVDSPIATLVVGDVEVPIHDVPVVPMRLPIAEVSEPVEAESLEANRSVDKPKPRRRGGVKQKRTAANRNLAYSDSHRSRSTSVASDMKAPKRGNHSSASGSPSQPHTIPTRSKDDEAQLSKDELKKNQVDRSEAGAAGDRRVRQQKTTSDSKRRIVVIESQPARSSRRDVRDGNREARKGSHSIEETSDTANGFQATKPRRVVLTEKKQQPQESSSPSKAEDGRSDNAKPKPSRRSRGGGPPNGHAVDDAASKPRRTKGERTRQEHRNSGEQASNSPDLTRKREPPGSGPNPRRNKSPVSSNGEKAMAEDPADQQVRPDRKRPQQAPGAPSPAESPGEYKDGAVKDRNGASGDNQRKGKSEAREQTVKEGTKPRRTVIRKVYVPKSVVAAPSLAAA